MAKYEKYLNINWIEVNKMTAEQLREAIKVLSPIATRQLKSLRQSEIGQLSPAYVQAIERGKAFGVRGIKKTDVNKLRQEYTDINNFIGAKTSSLRKFNKVRKDLFKRIAPKKKGKSPFKNIEQEKEFWRIYRKVQEDGAASGYGSEQIQQDIAQLFNNKSAIIKEINYNRIDDELAMSIAMTIPSLKDTINPIQDVLDYLNDNNLFINEQLELEDVEDNEDSLVNLILNKFGASYEQKSREMSGNTQFI